MDSALAIMIVNQVKRVLRFAKTLIRPERASASTQYEVLSAPPLESTNSLDGWYSSEVAKRQDSAFQSLINFMEQGKPRQDFVALADAIKLTLLAAPKILEVGCGSGYYVAVLDHLLANHTDYTGLDYSPAMIKLAAHRYTDRPFLVGDAAALPFIDRAFDIVVNGTALMHIPAFEIAIAESQRVARRFCIFHTVPVLQIRSTTILRKQAYGEPTIEIIFNEPELLGLFKKHGLMVRQTLESIPYDLAHVLGEMTTTRTYICAVMES